jgi:hypothetical protein
MVAVVIGDRTYEVAVPFKLRQMEAAAPYIDALNGASRQEATITGSMAMFRNMLGAILPGIQKIDPSVTLEALVDDFDPTAWNELREAFDGIFKRSGMTSGEAQAVAAEPGAAAA